MPSRWGTASRQARGYGSRWDRLRLRILKRDSYLCQACKDEGRVGAATSVDHIVAKSKGGTDDPGNLRSLCDEHRAAKDAEDRGRPLRPKRGREGFTPDGKPVW